MLRLCVLIVVLGFFAHLWCCGAGLVEQLVRVRLGHGRKKGLFRTSRGTYVKQYGAEQAAGYRKEKQCYRQLQGSPHFPRLVAYDDAKCQIELEDAGTPLRDLNEADPDLDVPDWKRQIRTIVATLAAHGIDHTDWHTGNILVKNGTLQVIDFDREEGAHRTAHAICGRAWRPHLPLASQQTLGDYRRDVAAVQHRARHQFGCRKLRK
uniref:Serine/threonine protein kinase n=1 Tax=Marseillevirus LCMAC103 TaxID=2506604 RepID=A0A481YVC9_9VIRU|nr:MAG: serine/threonine protein kinase [Marseillevirus LCMAC103]